MSPEVYRTPAAVEVRHVTKLKLDIGTGQVGRGQARPYEWVRLRSRSSNEAAADGNGGFG